LTVGWVIRPVKDHHQNDM